MTNCLFHGQFYALVNMNIRLFLTDNVTTCDKWHVADFHYKEIWMFVILINIYNG